MTHSPKYFAAGLAACWLSASLALAQESLPTPPVQAAAGQEATAEPLEYGPIHEAFADAFTLEERNQLTVNQQPPAPVNELPPEQTIDNQNAQWINGYWMFDDVRSDFVWVSGVWRVIPPDQRWVPGYWAEGPQTGQYSWTSGFWTSADDTQFTYLSAPPASLEQGPSSPAPDANHFWVPGCWRWNGSDYAWRTGRWYPTQQNWVWCPSRYNYTPRGYVYVNGYWDYPIQDRGLLYAPVSFNNYRGGNTLSYRPNSVLDTAALLTYLLVDNNRGRYYYRGTGANQNFGQYGYNNWYDTYGNNRGHRGGYGYDPLYTFYSSNYGRSNNNWYNDYSRHYGSSNVGGGGLVQNISGFAQLLQKRDNDRDDNDFYRGQRHITMKPFTNDDNDRFRDHSDRLRDFSDMRNRGERSENAREDVRASIENRGDVEDRRANLLEAMRERNDDRRDDAQDRLEDRRDTLGEQQKASRERLEALRNRQANGLENSNRPDINRPETNRPINSQPGNNRPDNNRLDGNRDQSQPNRLNLPDAGRRPQSTPGTQPGQQTPNQPRPGTQQLPGQTTPGAPRLPGALNPLSQPGTQQRPGAINPKTQPAAPGPPGNQAPSQPGFRGFRGQGNRGAQPQAQPQSQPQRQAQPQRQPRQQPQPQAQPQSQPSSDKPASGGGFRGFRGQKKDG